MRHDFHGFEASTFLRLSLEERVAKCREMAQEARRLAEHADEEHREDYLDLARRWCELADEMERLNVH